MSLSSVTTTPSRSQSQADTALQNTNADSGSSFDQLLSLRINDSQSTAPRQENTPSETDGDSEATTAAQQEGTSASEPLTENTTPQTAANGETSAPEQSPAENATDVAAQSVATEQPAPATVTKGLPLTTEEDAAADDAVSAEIIADIAPEAAPAADDAALVASDNQSLQDADSTTTAVDDATLALWAMLNNIQPATALTTAKASPASDIASVETGSDAALFPDSELSAVTSTLAAATTGEQTGSTARGMITSASQTTTGIDDVDTAKSTADAYAADAGIDLGSDNSGTSAAAVSQETARSVAGAGSNLSNASTAINALTASAQAPVLQTSSVSAAPTTALINAQLGSDAWQQAVSQQVLLSVRNGQQTAELKLHPQELGSLQISLTLDDNQAQIHLVSPHSQVRAAIEAALPHLRTSLAESGIDLGQASIGGESSSSDGQQAASDSGSSGSSSYNTPTGTAAEPDTAVPVSLQQMASAVNGVDIFA